jgi:phage shock protein A
MKSELERMEKKIGELEARKGTIAARTSQAKAGGGVEALGKRGPGPGAFDEFRRMEDQIEGVETAVQAQRELDAMLAPPSPTGMSPAEVEAKFRALEAGVTDKAGAPAATEVDAELAQLKKKIRIAE